MHRGEHDRAAEQASAARAALDEAQQVLRGFPAIAGAGFLHDAEKEYAEARLFAVLATGGSLVGHAEVGVGAAAWLNGMAEAASELRRHALDRLRDGELATSEALLARMDTVFGELVQIDLPDALTGGLRRTLDALRAVIERTRGDITAAVLQERLRAALTDRLT